MSILHRLSKSTTVILTLLQFTRPASAQTVPESEPTPPTTTVSSLAATSTPTTVPSYNFTYPDFIDHYNSGIEVSFKDTIDASWVANGLQHAPILQIQCWTRNDSSSFIYYQTSPSYTHNVITAPDPSVPTYLLALTPYRKYSPCQLRLVDPHQSNFIEGSGSVTSVAIFISQKTNASTPGVTWSEENPAPKVAVDAGVATVKSDSAGMDHKALMGGMWTFLGALAAVMVLS